MARDAIWQYASEDQLQDAQMAIERSVMNRIFKLAFYPNQDGDILRDQWVARMFTVLHKVVLDSFYCQCYEDSKLWICEDGRGLFQPFNTNST